ncbi:MAG: TonB family protein [Bdellovibrionota bacterium]
MSNAALYRVNPVSQEEEFLASVGKEQLCIGKSDAADVQLNDLRCNGIHAILEKTAKAEDYLLLDLGSHFGTYLNGERVQEARVKAGEMFVIGKNHLVVRENSQVPDALQANQLAQNPLAATSPQTDVPLTLVTSNTVLEVGLFWGDQALELRTFTEGTAVTLGNQREATFGVTLADTNTEKAPFIIAKYEKGQLQLFIPSEATGIVWLGKELYALDALRHQDKNSDFSRVLNITLRIGDRAQIEFGELSLSFQFVQPTYIAPVPLLQRVDKTFLRIFGSFFALYGVLFMASLLIEPEMKEKTLEDVPKEIRQVLFNAGIENAMKRQRAAIGQLADNLKGGRAKGEEGKASANRQAEQSKAAQKSPPKNVASKNANAPAQKVDLDAAFNSGKTTGIVNTVSMAGKPQVGNTAAALVGGGFARGTKGLGSGGGGQSVGIGQLTGDSTGGGLGAGDYGLSPSKGKDISVAENDEIVILGGLDPEVIASIIRRYLPQIRHCYEQQLAVNPDLKGKVTVSFAITGDGSVKTASVAESSLRSAATEQCILAKIKTWSFPKPKGGGTVGVRYPFLLMSNTGN